jgi:Flp pilus assembly protein protease CpaA
VFYLLGGMGGGDIKLMAGFGAIIPGVEQVVTAAIMAALVGAMMALVFLAARFVKKKLVPEGTITGSGLKSSIPYAPAITAGVLLSFAKYL